MNLSKIFPHHKFYGWNPIKGICPYDCKLPDGQSYCWSRDNKLRFKETPQLSLNTVELNKSFPKEPSRILVCWTVDLFHPSIKDEIIRMIINRTVASPHTFFFLTKNPERYENFYFPQNCWLGTSVTCNMDLNRIYHLNLQIGNFVFISIEPIFEEMKVMANFWKLVQWTIVGRLTQHGHKYDPKKEWIENLIRQHKIAKRPIYLKDSLAPIWGEKLIQEIPE
jgi:protein gp37